MPHVNLTTIQPVELLEALKAHQFLAPYHLTFCCDQDGGGLRYKSRFTACGSPRQHHFCTNSCLLALEDAVGRAIAGNRPVVFQCSVGLLNFAVPLRAGDIPFTCLIGGGVRDRTIDLARMESLAADDGMDAFALLAEIEELPVATVDEVEEVARKVQELVPSLLARNLHSQIFEKTMQRLTAISGISTGIDSADSVCDLMGLISETLGVLFDISKIAVLIPQNGPTSPYTVKGIWGLPGIWARSPDPRRWAYSPGTGRAASSCRKTNAVRSSRAWT